MPLKYWKIVLYPALLHHGKKASSDGALPFQEILIFFGKRKIEINHKNFRAIYTNRDENFFDEFHSLSRSIGMTKNNKMNT
jgi:hypothetical protein